MPHVNRRNESNNSRSGVSTLQMVLLLSSMMLYGCSCYTDKSSSSLRISGVVSSLGSSIASCHNREISLPPWNIRGGGQEGDVEEEAAGRELSGIQLALAGAAATMVVDISMHPIDCIKTLQQSHEGIGLSMLAAAQTIWKTKRLFSGLSMH
jgi:hypothetical protein